MLLLAAGCASPDVEAPPGPAPETDASPFSILPVGRDGAEPTIGVLSDGTLVMAGAFGEDLSVRLLRSTDAGASWEPIGDDVMGPKVDVDPWVWVDPATDRIFHAPLYPGCTWLAWSDDAGETWSANPAAGCGFPAHDHQKLTTGPPPAGVPTVGYPSVVYYAYNSILVTGALPVADPPAKNRVGTVVSVSLDGGRTFTPGVVAHESDACHVGLNGPIAVAPDGTAYLPKPTCEGLDVMVSRDAGISWERHSLTEGGSLPDFAYDPSVAVDGQGNAYAVWPGADALLRMSVSRDGGTTWSTPVLITPPDVRATVFSAAAATNEGDITVAYLGTTADPATWPSRTSSDAPEGTLWNLYATQTRDGATFATTRLTTDEDPVQVGCIWMRGGSNQCRNLYDFIDVKTHQGVAYVSYVDGCVACEPTGQSEDGALMLARLPAGAG